MNNVQGIKEVFFILVKKIYIHLTNKLIAFINFFLPHKAKIKNISFNLSVIGTPDQREVLAQIIKWKDPTWEDFEHIRIVDKEKGVEQADYQRTFVSLSDYCDVCDFVKSIQEKVKASFSSTPLLHP